jgi:hypothetical protein
MNNRPDIFIKNAAVHDAQHSNVGHGDNFKTNVGALIDAGHVVAVGEDSIENTFNSSKDFIDWFDGLSTKRMQMDASTERTRIVKVEELVWEPEDPDEYRNMDSPVLSAVRSNGCLVIIFKGWNSDVSKHYEGKISLRLVTDVQTYQGNYRADTLTTTSIPFTLTGKFIDQDLTSFEGRWEEPYYSAKFSF